MNQDQNSQNHKRVPVGAFLLGAVAGAVAGILFAPKSGRETREDIKETLTNIKDDVAERVSKLKDVTKDTYQDVVDSVVAGYQEAKKVTAEEASDIKDDLKQGYEDVAKAARDAKK